ncbi:MAG: hypothetical protein AB7O38_02465, partial [Pirellulaceae bacterium]
GNELNLGTNTTVTGFTNPRDFSQGFTHLCRPGQSWDLVGHLFFNVESGMRHGWGEVKLSQ